MSLLGELDQHDLWKTTLIGLRDSFFLGHDDVDFAFSELPATPLYQHLQRLLHGYLDSELRHDRTASYWKALEALKSSGAPMIDLRDATIIPSTRATAITLEYVRALQNSHAVGNIMTAPFFHFEASDSDQQHWPSVAFEASTPALMDRLVISLRKRLERGIPPQSLHIVHAGSKADELYLQFRLDDAQIPWQSHTDSLQTASYTTLKQHDWWQLVRDDRSLPLKERLVLGHAIRPFWESRIPVKGEFSQHLKQLVDKKRLSEIQAQHLEKIIPTPTAPSVEMRPNAVNIFPWHCVAALAGHYYFYLVTDEAFKAEDQTTLLSEKDILILQGLGFSLRSWNTPIKALETQLGLWQQPSPCHRQFFAHTSRPEVFTRLNKLRSPARREIALSSQNVLGIAPRSFSATQLERYAKCPAQYFLSQKLRFEPKSFENKYALVLGQCLHETLEIWVRDHGLSAFIDEAQRAQTESALLALFELRLSECGIEVSESHAWHPLLCAHFKKLLQNVFTLERSLDDLFPGHQPIAFEKAFNLTLNNREFRGKIDRVDQLPDGSALILDYKTGTVDFSPNQIQSGKHFQAWLYWQAKPTGKRNAAMLFYDLKKGELRRGLIAAEGLEELKKEFTRGHWLREEALDALHQEAMNHMERITESITLGSFTSTPSSATCAHCSYPVHCRQGDSLV